MKKIVKILLLLSGLFFLGIGLEMKLSDSTSYNSLYFISGLILMVIGLLTLVSNSKTKK